MDVDGEDGVNGTENILRVLLRQEVLNVVSVNYNTNVSILQNKTFISVLMWDLCGPALCWSGPGTNNHEKL